ncbi:RHS repeat-associated core domain-containing protein, partial [Accumulibacter sp.]|uniref:RHS repeat-associated core domain-containing protein n=1 Tax=Accumulibacter sp. TaxID=2053492 RepID=UPI0025F65396
HVGLRLMRSRWHDAALGAWLTRDPAGYADGMCLYRYVKGNPLVYFDPFGLGALSNWEFIKMAVGLGPDGGAAAVWSGAKEGAAGGLSHTVNSATFGATDAVGVTNSTAHQGQEYAVSDAAGKVASAALIAAGGVVAGEALAALTTSSSTTLAAVGEAGTTLLNGVEAAQSIESVAEGAARIAQGDLAGGTLEAAGGLLGLKGGGKTATAAAKGEQAAKEAAGQGAKGGTYKLVDPETGEVMRTGRTKDLARRKMEHERHPDTKDLKFEKDMATDDYNIQRGREQKLHDHHKPPMNKINPIDPKNPNRQKYMDSAPDVCPNK